MKIEDCTIGRLIMTDAISYSTRDQNYQPVTKRRVGKIIDYCMNSSLEVIPVVEWFDCDFDGLGMGPWQDHYVMRKQGSIHHGNIIPFDSATYYSNV